MMIMSRNAMLLRFLAGIDWANMNRQNCNSVSLSVTSHSAEDWKMRKNMFITLMHIVNREENYC